MLWVLWSLFVDTCLQVSTFLMVAARMYNINNAHSWWAPSTQNLEMPGAGLHTLFGDFGTTVTTEVWSLAGPSGFAAGMRLTPRAPRWRWAGSAWCCAKLCYNMQYCNMRYYAIYIYIIIILIYIYIYACIYIYTYAYAFFRLSSSDTLHVYTFPT